MKRKLNERIKRYIDLLVQSHKPNRETDDRTKIKQHKIKLNTDSISEGNVSGGIDSR